MLLIMMAAPTRIEWATDLPRAQDPATAVAVVAAAADANVGIPNIRMAWHMAYGVPCYIGVSVSLQHVQ